MYLYQTLKIVWDKIMVRLITNLINMSLPARLIKLRKEKGLTQLAMAETLGIHVNSLKKYESGQTQPSLDVLKKIATALHISSDFLLFEEHERGPNDDLSLQFEAIRELSSDEQSIVKEVLDSLIIKYQTRRWDSARN
jgi:transcriptional regulator with XRE-family HTH domain